jgi:hypothetical protein
MEPTGWSQLSSKRRNINDRHWLSLDMGFRSWVFGYSIPALSHNDEEADEKSN